MVKNKYAVVGYYLDYDSDTEEEFKVREVYSTWDTKELADQERQKLIDKFGHDSLWFSLGLSIEPCE